MWNYDQLKFNAKLVYNNRDLVIIFGIRYSSACMTWRLVGESVPEEERIVAKDSAGDSLLNASSSTHNLPLVAGGPMAAGMAGAVSDVERSAWQQEKEKLYQMLDDKVTVAVSY